MRQREFAYDYVFHLIIKSKLRNFRARLIIGCCSPAPRTFLPGPLKTAPFSTNLHTLEYRLIALMH